MYGGLSYQHENTPDPLDEFLAQLMKDVPDVLPPLTSEYTSTSAHASVPVAGPSSIPSSSAVTATTTGTAITPYYVLQSGQLTCQWVSPPDYALVCGALIPPDAKHACNHLRVAHQIRGNEKEVIHCHWRDCPAPPMQRGSLVRHVLTVHLGLMRWRCQACGKSFSRKGTAHACTEDL